MADTPITELTPVTPNSGMLIPVADPAQPTGLKNGSLTIEALTAALGPTGGLSIANYYVLKAAALASLPTAPNPGGPPIWWNNGGVETFS